MMRSGFGNLGMLAGGLIGLLLFLLFIALVVVAIIALVKYLNRQKRDVGTMPPAPTPAVNPSLQILDERLAKGEIDEEEYKRKKELLTK